MKRLIILLAAGGFFTCVFSQQIFRTNLQGTGVQSFSSSVRIDGFTVSGPDDEGYISLVAHAGSKSGEIVKTKRRSMGFQDFILPAGEYITGFETLEPDKEGYVYLVAVGSDGSKGEILKTRSTETAIQAYTAPDGIWTLSASGPDEGKYVYLAVGEKPAGCCLFRFFRTFGR